VQELRLIVWSRVLSPFEGLELQWIPVDDDGAIALASALNVSSSALITLELAINKISDRGAKALRLV
jgi:hypothetical protein